MSRKDKGGSSGKSGDFLGSLRSEFDESESGLHRDFETLAGLTGALRSAYLSHRIRPEAAAEVFQRLRLRGSDGHEWTIGASTGGWYRRSAGGGQWSAAPTPVGVDPADGERPDWLDEGIARYMTETDPTAARAVPSGPSAIVNPFQSKTSAGADEPGGVVHAVPGLSRLPSTVGGDEDVDWILEEWEDFDSQVEELRGIRARVEPAKETLPGRLPKNLKADRRLTDSLAGVPAPAERAGSEPDDGPPGRQINPEDFFFRPED